MIKRINLIEREPFSFTYQKLVMICVAVLLLNVGLYGLQLVKANGAQKQIAQEEGRFATLKNQRRDLLDKRPKSPTQTINIGKYQSILEKLQSLPQWGALLRSVSNDLPNTVWITQVKTVVSNPNGGASAAAKTPAAKKKPGNAQPAPDEPVVKKSMGVEISGVSLDVSAVSTFLTTLEKSEEFSRVVLNDSGMEAYGYRFIITAELVDAR